MAIANQVIKRIEQQVDIVELISRYISLERRGDRYWGCCPFHVEKTPSFAVSPARQSYYCFGCKKSGGIFQFVMEIEKIGFVEAVHYFANQLGIELQETNEAQDQYAREKTALLGLYQRITKTFEYYLWQSPEGEKALTYLQQRGLSEQTIRDYCIGYAPLQKNSLYKFLTDKGYSAHILGKSGLFSHKYPQISFFQGRVLFPVFQPTGEIIAFSGRILPEQQQNTSLPKYLNSPDTAIYNKKHQLFGLFQAKKAIAGQGFMLCEGAMDVCAMHEMGFPQAIASLGTGFTLEQAKLITRFTQNGFIIFDNDEAGEKAKKAAISLCFKCDMSVKIVNLEQEKDPGEILQKKNLKALQKSIDNAILPMDFLINTLEKLSSPDAMASVQHCRQLFPFVNVVTSPVLQTEMLRTIATHLNLTEGIVKDEFERFCKKKDFGLGVEKKAGEPKKTRGLYQFHGSVYELLKIFLENMHCRTEYLGLLHKSWLVSPESRAIEEYLEKENEEMSFSVWLEQQENFDEEVKQYFLQPMESVPLETLKTTAQRLLKQLEVKDLETQCSLLTEMIKRAEQRGDNQETVNDLMKDYVLLLQELQQLKVGL